MKSKSILKNTLISLMIFCTAVAVCLLLSQLHDDNNPFAVPVFILAVALISRVTSSYVYGILASCGGVFCVNYLFTYPFWEFDMSISGYPLTFAAMLLVSIIISTLTTQIKRQQHLRFDMEAEKMRADLLRSVSHDLRTPLASILGASSALLDDAELPASDRQDLLREINKDAQWLIRITENILSLTKFSGGNVQLRTEIEVLEEIIGSAIVKFRRTHPEFSVTVSRPEQILLVPMDAVLIEQVLLNLFENVSMHAKTADHIQVSISAANGRATVSIQDNGTGFPKQYLPLLFDGCLHVNDTTPPGNCRSMGIGLSVCRSIIRAHSGDISAENAPEGGAVVRFYLPCEEDEHAE